MGIPEDHYLSQLDQYLINGNLTQFERLIKRLDAQGTSVDLAQIPNRAEKITNLFIASIEIGYNIDEMLRTFQFVNDYQLLRENSYSPDILIPIQEPELIRSNLESLFGDLSSGFYEYFINFLPNFLSEYLKFMAENPRSASTNFAFYQTNVSLKDMLPTLYSWIDAAYSTYGLRTRKIGKFKKYITNYFKNRKEFDPQFYELDIKISDLITQNLNRDLLFFFEGGRSTEKHLIDGPLLEKIIKKFEAHEYKYEYPIVSMVIQGGIGPEGKGFAYLTPMGEVVEVCSDVKQNKAYIIEYKKYLKSIFLDKLATQMRTWNLSKELQEETITFFNENIQTKMVGYGEVEVLLEKEILQYLNSHIKSYITPEFVEFLKKSLLEILIPIKMED
ncbi:MAG TPA: hypothetical protein VMV49_03790 [Candidatus Deferrimicrobium sp.]|nr:hypothetical protein [Candidatus Deferrimicrobium sp.]